MVLPGFFRFVPLLFSHACLCAPGFDGYHASAAVSLDTYAHTQDSRRRALTEKISKEFYGGFSTDDRQDQLMQLLDEDPEMKKKLLQALLAEHAQKSGC